MMARAHGAARQHAHNDRRPQLATPLFWGCCFRHTARARAKAGEIARAKGRARVKGPERGPERGPEGAISLSACISLDCCHRRASSRWTRAAPRETRPSSWAPPRLSTRRKARRTCAPRRARMHVPAQCTCPCTCTFTCTCTCTCTCACACTCTCTSTGQVLQLTGGVGAELAIDAAGFKATCEDAVWSARRGGRMVQVRG